MALSKAHSESGGVAMLDSLVSQDLSPGEGGAVQLGDSVEIKYTSWLVTDHALGAVSHFCSRILMTLFYYFSLQCFDTVGWVTGRASGL